MKITKLFIAVGLALCGTAPLFGAQTNLVQTLQINLTAYTQASVTTNGTVISSTADSTKIQSSDVIQWIGAATSASFSPKAQLLFVKPLPDGDSSIVVRDGTNSVDVSQFFSHEVSDPRITQGKFDTSTGVGVGREHSLQSFGVSDSSAGTLASHFEVSGLARATFVGVVSKGVALGSAYSFVADVAGNGDLNGTPAIVAGTISGLGKKIEVLQ